MFKPLRKASSGFVCGFCRRTASSRPVSTPTDVFMEETPIKSATTITKMTNTSALVHGTQPDDLHEEIPRVLVYDRDTLPRHLPPEFVTNHILAQSKIMKLLEWKDMMKRRKVVDIPEFYPGSIVKVEFADQWSLTGMNSFVGRCIFRSNDAGIRHSIQLRNVINNEGIEMEISLYNPRVHSITVLKLERWLDQDLTYLRDALPKYCTVPLDMKPEELPEEVPVFREQVKMKLKPWGFRWERYNLKNADFSDLRFVDTERARRWSYYEFDRSWDLYHEATDEMSKEEYSDINQVINDK